MPSQTRYPTICANTDTGVSWSNPSDAALMGSSGASSTLLTTQQTRYLQFTGFGFTIPDGAVIDGIEAAYEHSSTVLSVTQILDLRIIRLGVVDVLNAILSPVFSLLSFVDQLIGGPLAQVSSTKVSIQEVLRSDFGYALRAVNAGILTGAAILRNCRLTVYYSICSDMRHGALRRGVR